MIAIIDYGVGNLFSLTASLKYIGEQVKVTGEAKDIQAADRIILPGVGAFGDAIDKLKATGLVEVILEETEKGKPLLGICLGMQLLFDKSHEYGQHQGLGLVKGDILSLQQDLPGKGEGSQLKVPHIGWNSLHLKGGDPLLKYVSEGDYVYYVHSYYAKCTENTIASSNYHINVTGAVRKGSIYGTQFHPEKSGTVGLNILRAFTEL